MVVTKALVDTIRASIHHLVRDLLVSLKGDSFQVFVSIAGNW